MVRRWFVALMRQPAALRSGDVYGFCRAVIAREDDTNDVIDAVAARECGSSRVWGHGALRDGGFAVIRVLGLASQPVLSGTFGPRLTPAAFYTGVIRRRRRCLPPLRLLLLRRLRL